MPARQSVLLDMDPGVDDALAILLALRSPELDVRAITVVAGNVGLDLCTRNALRILALLGRTEGPPVAQGAARPLVKPPFAVPSIHGSDGLGALDPEFYPPLPPHLLLTKPAREVILQAVVTEPGEITIVATGPLTNIATCLRENRGAMRKVRELMIMGGAVDIPANIPPGAAEFNFFVDPHAAEIVLDSGLPITLVPLDVTHKVPLTRAAAQDAFGGQSDPASRFVLGATRRYMDFYRDDQGHDGCYLHDPLAVGVAIDPSLVTTEERRIYVETEGKVTAGMSLPFRHPTVKKPEPNVRVCTGVDSERFLRLFVEGLVWAARGAAET